MLNLAPLLIVVICSGYLFARHCYPASISINRAEGHALYFGAVLYSTLNIATLTVVIAVFQPDKYSLMDPPTVIGKVLSGDESNQLLAYAIPWALFLAYFINFFLAFVSWIRNGRWDLSLVEWYQHAAWKKPFVIRAIESRELDKLIVDSLDRTIAMMITLDDEKMYVGFAITTPNPSSDMEYLRIMPIASGYRDPVTKVAVFETDYYDPLSRIAADQNIELLERDFEIVLPMAKILSAHLFDFSAYQQFDHPTSLNNEEITDLTEAIKSDDDKE